MKKKKIQFQQYIFEGTNTEGANEEFLDKTAPLIGYIVHSFNTLEQLLNNALCDLFHDDMHDLGLIVICKMNYSAKVDLFKRFLIRHEEMLGEKMPIFEKLINNLVKAGELRNQVIHADWESAHDNGYTFTKFIVKKKSGIQNEYVQFTPEALEEILQFIDETYGEFDDYEEEIAEIHSL